jgi:hypothetical protein
MLIYQPSAFWLENDPGIQFAFADGGAPLTADYAAIVPVFTKHHLMLPKVIPPLAAAGKGGSGQVVPLCSQMIGRRHRIISITY